MTALVVAALIVLLASSPAPAATSAAAPTIVEDEAAMVDGRPIMLSQYRKEVESSLAYLRRTNPAAADDPAVRRRLGESTLEELITRELLIQAGKRDKIEVGERDLDDAVAEIKNRFKDGGAGGEPLGDEEAEQAFSAKLKADGVDYEEYRKSLTPDLMARKVIAADVTAKLLPPTGEETRAYFDRIQAYLASKSTALPAGMPAEDGEALRSAARQVKILSSEGARFQCILVRLSPGAPENERRRALKTAAELKRRLDQGEDFGKLAREESEDPDSAPLGGDVGFTPRGAAAPELEAALYSLTVGRVSEPILTELGYDIVRVTEKRSAEAPSYDRFKADLEGFLANLAQHKALKAYIDALREKAVIERRELPR